MATFELISEQDQATFNGSTGVELTPYRDLITAMIAEVGTFGGGPGYSLWHGVKVGADETSKAIRRRLTTAATEAGKHVQVHPKSDEKQIVVRLRPAPVARPASKNGPVTVVQAGTKAT